MISLDRKRRSIKICQTCRYKQPVKFYLNDQCAEKKSCPNHKAKDIKGSTLEESISDSNSSIGLNELSHKKNFKSSLAYSDKNPTSCNDNQKMSFLFNSLLKKKA